MVIYLQSEDKEEVQGTEGPSYISTGDRNQEIGLSGHSEKYAFVLPSQPLGVAVVTHPRDCPLLSTELRPVGSTSLRLDVPQVHKPDLSLGTPPPHDLSHCLPFQSQLGAVPPRAEPQAFWTKQGLAPHGWCITATRGGTHRLRHGTRTQEALVKSSAPGKLTFLIFSSFIRHLEVANPTWFTLPVRCEEPTKYY